MSSEIVFEGNRYAIDENIANTCYPVVSWSMSSGKTYKATHGHFARMLEHVSGQSIEGLVVLAVPTTALRDEVLSKYADCTEALESDDLLFPDVSSDKVKVCCFGKLANLVKDGCKLYAPGLLIVDECDLIARWAVCFDGYAQTWDWVASNRPKMKFLALTATPQFLTEYVNNYGAFGNVYDRCGFRFVDITPNSEPKHHAEHAYMAKDTRIETLIAAANPSAENKVLVYVQSARRVEELAAKFAHSAFIVSSGNDKASRIDGMPICERLSAQRFTAIDKTNAFVQEREYSIHEYLNTFHELPESVNLLIINDAASTGINIEDKRVKTVICKSIDIATICQAKGRVRHDIERLYLTYSDGDIAMCGQANKAALNYFNLGELPIGYDGRFFRHDERTKGDILCYPNSEKLLVDNVFAKAMCAYRKDACRALWDNPASFFEPLNKEMQHRAIEWLNDYSKEQLRVAARRFKDVAAIDWRQSFGLSESVPQIYLTAKEMNNALRHVHIRKPNRNEYGLATMVAEANASGQVLIFQEQKKKRRIDGEGVKRNTKWYCVSLPCS